MIISLHNRGKPHLSEHSPTVECCCILMWHENSFTNFLHTTFLQTALFPSADASGLHCFNPANSYSIPAQSAATQLRTQAEGCALLGPVQYVCAGACQKRRMWWKWRWDKVRYEKRRRQKCNGEQVEGLWFILWFEHEINLCLTGSVASMRSNVCCR